MYHNLARIVNYMIQAQKTVYIDVGQMDVSANRISITG